MRPIKALYAKGFGKLPWLTILRACCHINARRVTCPDFLESGQRALCLVHTDSALCALSLADFHLCPLPVIIHNCECNGFQGVLWILANYQHWSWFLEAPKLQLVSEGRALLWRLYSDAYGQFSTFKYFYSTKFFFEKNWITTPLTRRMEEIIGIPKL